MIILCQHNQHQSWPYNQGPELLVLLGFKAIAFDQSLTQSTHLHQASSLFQEVFRAEEGRVSHE